MTEQRFVLQKDVLFYVPADTPKDKQAVTARLSDAFQTILPSLNIDLSWMFMRSNAMDTGRLYRYSVFASPKTPENIDSMERLLYDIKSSVTLEDALDRIAATAGIPDYIVLDEIANDNEVSLSEAVCGVGNLTAFRAIRTVTDLSRNPVLSQETRTAFVAASQLLSKLAGMHDWKD